MQYRTLGKTGLRVAAVGLGGIPIQRIDAGSTRKLLEYLAQSGVNYIDTARGYTVSEALLGEALENAKLRDKYILATKSMARSYEDMKRDISTSLANLRTDYIDIYQLHNPSRDADLNAIFAKDGAMRALLEAKSQGLIRHIGATAHKAQIALALLEHAEIETIMFPFNIVENQGEELMRLALERNVGFIAMKPLAGGNITDGRLAVRYCLNNEACTVVIPGMADTKEAADNISAADDLSPLKASELGGIADIKESLGGNFCRRCAYCAPCTVGIDIPSCFIMQGYLEHYDLADWARGRYAAMAGKASACIKCGKCEERCPYDLPIREKLSEVAALFGE